VGNVCQVDDWFYNQRIQENKKVAQQMGVGGGDFPLGGYGAQPHQQQQYEVKKKYNKSTSLATYCEPASFFERSEKKRRVGGASNPVAWKF